jgi:hypothetical protein
MVSSNASDSYRTPSKLTSPIKAMNITTDYALEGSAWLRKMIPTHPDCNIDRLVPVLYHDPSSIDVVRRHNEIPGEKKSTLRYALGYRQQCTSSGSSIRAQSQGLGRRSE